MFGIKTRIKKYLAGSCVSPHPLESIRISPVGYPCNHACPMCWRASLSAKEKKTFQVEELNRLTLKEYAQLFKNMPKSVKNIEVVGGGEPLLFSNIEKVFFLIKQMQCNGKLITNGSLMNDSIINTLLSCSWDALRISLHAGTKNIHQKVTGAKDFDVIIRNIKQLIRKRGSSRYPKVSLLFVIQKDNISDITNFVALAVSLQVDEIEFTVLTPTCDPRLLLNEKQRKQVVAKLKALKTTLHIPNNIAFALNMFAEHPLWMNKKQPTTYYKNKYCSIVGTSVDMSADGRVVPCCMAYGEYEYGNIRNKPLRQIWKDGKQFRKKLMQGKFHSFCYRLCTFEFEHKK